MNIKGLEKIVEPTGRRLAKLVRSSSHAPHIAYHSYHSYEADKKSKKAKVLDKINLVDPSVTPAIG